MTLISWFMSDLKLSDFHCLKLNFFSAFFTWFFPFVSPCFFMIFLWLVFICYDNCFVSFVCLRLEELLWKEIKKIFFIVWYIDVTIIDKNLLMKHNFLLDYMIIIWVGDIFHNYNLFNFCVSFCFIWIFCSYLDCTRDVI